MVDKDGKFDGMEWLFGSAVAFLFVIASLWITWILVSAVVTYFGLPL